MPKNKQIELLQLNRNDLIEILDHTVGMLNNFDLVALINQYTKTWVRYLPDVDEFVWTGVGERPSYITSIVEHDHNLLDNQ